MGGKGSSVVIVVVLGYIYIMSDVQNSTYRMMTLNIDDLNLCLKELVETGAD